MSTVITPIKGRTLLFKISDDDWTTTFTLVCLMNQRMTSSRNKTEVDTQCGVSRARGSVNRTYEMQFLANTTPDATAAGVGEASYKKWQEWFEADTALKFKRQDPNGSGTNLHQEGVIYIDSINDEATVDGNLLVTTTVSVEGNLDIAP